MKTRLVGFCKVFALLFVIITFSGLLTGCGTIGNAVVDGVSGQPVTAKGHTLLPFQSTAECEVTLFVAGGRKEHTRFRLSNSQTNILVPNRDLICEIKFKGERSITKYSLKPEWNGKSFLWLVVDITASVFIPIVGIPATIVDFATWQFRNYDGQFITITKPVETPPKTASPTASPKPARGKVGASSATTNSLAFELDPQPAPPAGITDPFPSKWFWIPSTNVVMSMTWQEPITTTTNTVCVLVPQPPRPPGSGAGVGRWIYIPAPGTGQPEWRRLRRNDPSIPMPSI